MDSLRVYDHVEPTDSDLPDGTYRVVGTTGESVTLLRVADAGRRRVHTGEVVTVEGDALDALAPTGNPDGNRPLGARVTSTLESSYWSARVFVRELAANPASAAVAAAVLLAGAFGEPYLPLPEVAFGVLILAGSLALAYVGSGRL